MLTIFLRVLQDRKIALLIYLLASVIFLWMYVALFPFVEEQSAQLEQMMKTYPESFQKAFNADMTAFTTFGGYISTEMFGFIWPFLVAFMSIALGALAMAGEIEKGTIELLLSQPVSRTKLYIAKYLAGLTNVFLFSAISILAIIPFALAYDIDFSAGNLFKLLFVGLLFGWALFSLASLFSSLAQERGRVYFLSAAVIIVMYVLNIVSALKESLSDLKYFSFFHYFPSKILVDGKIDNWAYLVFLVVIVFSTIFGAIIFKNRDITT